MGASKTANGFSEPRLPDDGGTTIIASAADRRKHEPAVSVVKLARCFRIDNAEGFGFEQMKRTAQLYLLIVSVGGIGIFLILHLESRLLPLVSLVSGHAFQHATGTGDPSFFASIESSLRQNATNPLSAERRRTQFAQFPSAAPIHPFEDG